MQVVHNTDLIAEGTIKKVDAAVPPAAPLAAKDAAETEAAAKEGSAENAAPPTEEPAKAEPATEEPATEEQSAPAEKALPEGQWPPFALSCCELRWKRQNLVSSAHIILKCHWH